MYPWTKELVNETIAKYQAGLRLQEIAQQLPFQITIGGLSNLLRRCEIPTRGSREYKLSAVEIQKALVRYDEGGVTLRKLGAEVGCSSCNLHKRFKVIRKRMN